MTAPDPAEAARQVEAVNVAFYEAFETGDLELMRELWVDTADAVCVHPGAGPVRGASAINRSWALIMANTPYIQFFLTDVEIAVQGDTATLSCMENVLADGGESAEFGGGRAVATNVFRYVDQRWRLVVHHSSPIMTAGGEEA